MASSPVKDRTSSASLVSSLRTEINSSKLETASSPVKDRTSSARFQISRDSSLRTNSVRIRHSRLGSNNSRISSPSFRSQVNSRASQLRMDLDKPGPPANYLINSVQDKANYRVRILSDNKDYHPIKMASLDKILDSPVKGSQINCPHSITNNHNHLELDQIKELKERMDKRRVRILSDNKDYHPIRMASLDKILDSPVKVKVKGSQINCPHSTTNNHNHLELDQIKELKERMGSPRPGS
jgi:hypothetical protein